MKPETGRAMGGRYRLVSRIAVGGMGEVWVAHDDSLARDVAVKVLREEFAGDAGFLERFRTEARNSAGLSHPNIASLYDYGEQDGSGFLVMELVLGEPMSDLLDRQPVLPTRRLLPILAQTARALHAAHVGGVVHRDVKPGNILLARSGQVKITDFGISMAVNQVPMTASGMVMGTAQYLSPEQAIGKAATPASDIYSLGIVAYEALVGNRPFTGPTAVDIAVAHVNTAVPPMPDDIDPELSALVMRMLAKDPEQRPRSAASLARVLDDLLDGTPPGGIPVAGGRHTRFVDVVDAVEGAGSSGRRSATPGGGGPAGSAGHAASAGAGWSAGATAGTAPGTTGGSGTGAAQGSAPVSSGPGEGQTAVAGHASAPPSGPGAAAAPGPAAPAWPTSPAAVAAPAGQVGVGQGVAPQSVAGPGQGGPLPAGASSAVAPTAPARTGPFLPEGAVTVPGRQERPPDAPETEAHPPTFAPGTTRASLRADREGPATSLLRTSTTTGLRWGQLSRPLLALILMVVFALLGAAFADSLWGPGRTDGVPGDGGSTQGHAVSVVTSETAPLTSGMIATQVRHPAGQHPQTTTARDL